MPTNKQESMKLYTLLLLVVLVSWYPYLTGRSMGTGIRTGRGVSASESAVLNLLSVSGSDLVVASGSKLLVDDIADQAGTGSVTFTQGLDVPTGKTIATPKVEGITGEPLVVASVADQDLQLTAFGDGTGDVADIWFNTGNGNKWIINQTGALSEIGSRSLLVTNMAVDNITDRATSGPPSFTEGLTVPTGKTVATPRIEGITGEPLVVASVADQDLQLTAFGDGTGDTADILFNAGNTLMWKINQGGTLVENGAMFIKVTNMAADNITDKATPGPPSFTKGLTVSAGKMITTELIRIDERASPGAPAAGQAYLYRDSTTDDVEVDMETTQNILVAAGP